MIARLLAAWVALWLAVPALAADVVVWHAYRDTEAQALREVADAWTSRSGKTVELVPVGFDVFDSKVETAVPRGNGPDLLISAHSSLGKWVAMDLLKEVEGGAEGHRPITVEALTHDGALWGLPLSYKSVMLFYDPSVVSAPPQTTDELIEAAARLSEPPRASGCFSSGGGGRYGLAYQAASPYFHAAWMHGYGATVVGEGPVRLDSREHVRALGFVKQLQDDGLLPQRPTAQLVSSLYEAEKAAFVISGPWFVGSVTRPLVAAPLPNVSETG